MYSSVLLRRAWSSRVFHVILGSLCPQLYRIRRVAVSDETSSKKQLRELPLFTGEKRPWAECSSDFAMACAWEAGKQIRKRRVFCKVGYHPDINAKVLRAALSSNRILLDSALNSRHVPSILWRLGKNLFRMNYGIACRCGREEGRAF